MQGRHGHGLASWREGLCWRLGSGRKIDFWKDPWIPDIQGFKLSSTPPYEAMDNALVAEFIINNKWDLSNVDVWLTKDS